MTNQDMQKLKPGTLLEIKPFYALENNGKTVKRGAYHFIIDETYSTPGPGRSLGMIEEKTVVMYVRSLSSVTAVILHEGKLSSIHSSGVEIAKE